MESYKAYMDSRQVSDTLHAKLLALEIPKKSAFGGKTVKYTALAACAALLIGLGAQFTGPSVTPDPAPVPVESASPLPTQGSETANTGDGHPFIAQGPAENSKFEFPAIFAVDYADTTQAMEVAASRALEPGAFWVELNKEDIQKIFWGAEGKPEVSHFKTDTGDFPLFLMNWQGYVITGTALYHPNGDLEELTVRGKKGEDSFTLRLSPGHMPFEDCIIVSPAPLTTQVLGVEVSGRYQSYDCDGDKVIEHVVSSKFMVNDVGVGFENIGSGGMRFGEDEATDLGGAQMFNAMLVNHFCREDSHPYLDHLLHTDTIPAWREEQFSTIDAARSEEKFAPYLPIIGPKGYGGFFGRLSYQEGAQDRLFVRWTRGYDTVEVGVAFPEGDSSYYTQSLVDVTVPESYDWRLCEGSISEGVAPEYRLHFYMPTFRAADMSLEVVRARMTGHDTGGQSCRFNVLHDNGVAVCYSCDGVSAEYVWSLVEATL